MSVLLCLFTWYHLSTTVIHTHYGECHLIDYDIRMDGSDYLITMDLAMIHDGACLFQEAYNLDDGSIYKLNGGITQMFPNAVILGVSSDSFVLDNYYVFSQQFEIIDTFGDCKCIYQNNYFGKVNESEALKPLTYGIAQCTYDDRYRDAFQLQGDDGSAHFLLMIIMVMWSQILILYIAYELFVMCNLIADDEETYSLVATESSPIEPSSKLSADS